MIVMINGTSSAGKSSVSEALQQQLGDGWLYFSTDDYLNMLGPKFLGLHPDNPDVLVPNDICYATKHTDGTHEIVPGILCSTLYATIPEVLAMLAEHGFHIIVDSFITTMDDFKTYQSKLSKYGPFFIYLQASEDVIAAREEARGDRLKGSAIHWLRAFECQDACDLVINTENTSIKEVTAIALQSIRLHEQSMLF